MANSKGSITSLLVVPTKCGYHTKEGAKPPAATAAAAASPSGTVTSNGTVPHGDGTAAAAAPVSTPRRSSKGSKGFWKTATAAAGSAWNPAAAGATGSTYNPAAAGATGSTWNPAAAGSTGSTWNPAAAGATGGSVYGPPSNMQSGQYPSNLLANPVAAGVTGGVGGVGGAAAAGVTGAAPPPPVGGAAAAAGPRQFMASYDLLVGGDSTGGLFVWEPFNVPHSTGDRETPPRVVKQAHTGEVWAMCLAPGPEDPVATSARVYTAGGWNHDGHVGGHRPRSENMVVYEKPASRSGYLSTND